MQPLYSNVFRHIGFPLELVRKKALSTRRLNEFISWGGKLGRKQIKYKEVTQVFMCTWGKSTSLAFPLCKGSHHDKRCNNFGVTWKGGEHWEDACNGSCPKGLMEIVGI